MANLGKERELEKNKPVDPEALIVPKDVLSKQMLDLSAEIAASEDTMYYLDRALANDSLDAS